MLPSFVSNLFWGVTPSTEQEPSSAKEANEEHQAAVEVEHTAQEDGDWLLITRSQESAGSSSGNSNSPGLECDADSMCSEGSWVVTPAARFSGTNLSTFDTFHSMEDLLIEHPAMSVYQTSRQDNDSNNGDDTSSHNENNNDLERFRLERQARVLMRNRRRHEVATHLQVPQVEEGWSARSSHPSSSKPPRLTRRALKRQNVNSFRGGKQPNKAQKASRKAGRRRT